jgi:phosphate transport system substrate-binding protein
VKNKTYFVAALAALSLGAVPGVQAQNLSLKGSDTMLQLAQGWAQAYMQAHPGSTITVTGGGSSTGIAALVNGSTDIANASRIMKGSEVDKAKTRGFVPFEVPVARDGLAIIVNPGNPIKSLSIAQLKGIYSGAITNWKQVGGPDRAIIAVGRDSSSGTYGFFQDNVLGIGRPYRPDMQTTPSTNAIGQTVSQDAGAIGYVGVAYGEGFSSKVKIVPISRGSGEAIEPSAVAVKNGKYPLWRYLFMYTRGKPSGGAKKFIDWVRSDAGQDVVEKVGYYRIK